MLRLSQISIENFKNVLQGTINLTTLPEGPSILGLYGQNGSGKTSLIEAIELLKYLLQGKSLPASFADYIHVDSPYARVIYEFEMSLPNESEQDKSYLLRYEVSIRAAGSSSTQTDGPFQSPDHTPSTTASANQPGLAVEVFSEVLRYSELQANGRHGRLTTLIDTVSSVKPFGPASKAALLFGKDHPAGRSLRTDLEYHMRFARWTGRSAIFCDEFQRLLQEAPDHTAVPASLIGAVHDYGRNGLFVISKSDIGEISLPDGTLIPMDRSVTISTVSETELRYVVDGMNLVLGEIVPGLGIGHRILSRELMSDGREGVQIQLVSEKNEKTIPLKYESQGIKKIISVLHLLIRVYNQTDITVAIDELDAGIFEYLLGELLRILASKGKGQLIFTSHNLRPLETIDKQFVAFTTTNPKERYLRMSGVGSSSNLRDFYYRDLQLGGQRESLYDTTNNFDIALAFRQAGGQFEGTER